jgi:hypothetical protein
LGLPAARDHHIAAFALSIGTIAIVDFGLIGWGKHDAAKSLRETHSLTLLGLAIMLITGPLIFSSALMIAIIYNYTIHRKVVLFWRYARCK